MPSKVKANAVASGSAGFLKPTFSSLRKVVGKGDGKFSAPGKDATDARKTSAKSKSQNNIDTEKNSIAEESPLHSSSTAVRKTEIPAPPNSLNRTGGEIEIGHEQTIEHANSKSRRYDFVTDTNDEKINDARRVCDELRMQIEDLKLQQREFQNRIGKRLDSDDDCDLNLSNGKEVGLTSLNSVKTKLSETHEIPKLQNRDATPKPFDLKVLTNVMDDKDSYLTDDSFNLHGSVTSELTDSCAKDEYFDSKKITRLVSENERYKKKVRHLQAALNKLKRNQLRPASRSPDIAAHDIVYFNADLIGEGHLSYVYSGTVYKNQKAAIKKLIRPDMMSSSDRSYLTAEAGLLMTLHHQNIVEVYGVSTAPLQPMIVTELVRGRSLETRLSSSNAWPLSPVEYYSIARDSAVGLAYLHGQKPPVLHLNLRPCNILLTSSGRAKISDFGFSKIRLDAGVSSQVNLAYLAPELITFPVHLTTKLDVYSYGMILWKMSTLKEPYKNLKPSQILDIVGSGKRPEIPSELPSGFRAIISRSWDSSAMQRPSFKEVIILLETMILPEDWTKAISTSQLQRADTRGIVTPRDGGNVPETADKTPASYLTGHQEQERNGFGNTARRKISEELALESDMMSLGYVLHKSEYQRHDSDKYLRGFSPKSSTRHSDPNTPTRNSSRYRSTIAKLSPYKYSFLNASPLSPAKYCGRYPAQNGDRHRTGLSRPRYSAARNLNDELTAQSDKRPKSDRDRVDDTRDKNSGRDGRNGHSAVDVGTSEHTFQYGAVSTENQRLSVIDTNGNPDDASPLPLMDGDLRYHDQNLTVETPKFVTGDTAERSKVNPHDSTGVTNSEDLKNAVSIPYLKNLRSGDEVSSTSENYTTRSRFDEKLNSYVNEACRAESRNFVDAKGWRSDRSLLLDNRNCPAPSDELQVRSVGGTSAANGGARVISTTVSDSHETLMTAVYQPDEERRAGLYRTSRGRPQDISFTSSDECSTDGPYGIGVVSAPSTRDDVNGDVQRGEAGLHPSRRPSRRRPSRQRCFEREQSWNKLKNSYSPEPLAPHFVSGFESASRRSPGLSGAHERSSRTKRKDSSKSESRMNNGYRETSNSDGVESNETNEGSASTLSGTATDEVGQTLTQTARELAGVSGILQDAANRRKDKPHPGRKGGNDPSS